MDCGYDFGYLGLPMRYVKANGEGFIMFKDGSFFRDDHPSPDFSPDLINLFKRCANTVDRRTAAKLLNKYAFLLDEEYGPGREEIRASNIGVELVPCFIALERQLNENGG